MKLRLTRRNSMKSFLVIMFFILSFYFTLFKHVDAPDIWWHASWPYRRNITMDNSQNSNSLINYPVFVNVNYDSDMQSDFDDLRFTYYNSTSQEETELNYWIENYVSSNYAEVWINVSYIPANGYSTVYMYYGNLAVSTTSNGTKTFPFFDDFNDNSIDTNKWDTYEPTGVDVTETSGQMRVTVSGSYGVWYHGGARGKTVFGQNYALRMLSYYYSTGSLPNFKLAHGFVDSSTWDIMNTENATFHHEVYYYGLEEFRIHRFYNRHLSSSTLSFTSSPDLKWHIFELVRNGSTNTFETWNGTIEVKNETNVPNADLHPILYGAKGANTGTRYFYTEWLLVRKYSSPEPSYSFGSEEKPTPPKYFDNSTNSTLAGQPTLFSLKWTDNVDLDSYIFSFDNCTGSFSNVTETSFSTGGTEDWSNETYVINDTVGCTIRWKVYANDSSDNWNVSEIFTLVTTDIPPQWFNLSVYPASGVIYQPGQSYQFNITWMDNFGVDDVILEFNGIDYTNSSGQLSKDGNVYYRTFTDLSAGSYSYVWYANDTNDNWNSTGSMIYTINKSTTVSVNLYLNGTDGDKDYRRNSNANFTVTANMGGKTVKLDTNFTGWVIPSSITPLHNYTRLDYDPGVYSITGYFEGDENYTASSETHYLNLLVSATISVDLNATAVWWGEPVNVSGVAKKTGLDPNSNVEVKITFDNETICQSIPNTTSDGWYSCVFDAPYKLGTYTIEVEVTDPVTDELITNMTTLEVKIVWGEREEEMRESANVGCYEVPKLIQNPDGTIRRAMVRFCVWK